MSGSLPTGLLISALLKHVNDAGGIGMVRARGDADSGAILLILNEGGAAPRLVERVLVPGAPPALRPAGPTEILDARQIEDYWRRRRSRDPDLWVIELDTPSAQRFAAETMCAG